MKKYLKIINNTVILIVPGTVSKLSLKLLQLFEICSANQLTGFYMMGTLVTKVLIRICIELITDLLLVCWRLIFQV